MKMIKKFRPNAKFLSSSISPNPKKLCFFLHYSNLNKAKSFTKPRAKVIDSNRATRNLLKHSLFSTNRKDECENFFFHPMCSPITIGEVTKSFSVHLNFIDATEESNLSLEVEPHLQRHRYEFDHFDDAIHGYREIERSKWSVKCSSILQKVQKIAFDDQSNLIPQVHVLDLAVDGVIKPHVDSVRFCGNTIAVICLLSDAVMRLVNEQQKDQIIDILLPKRSLYIMKNESRYKYTHEILGRDVSYFGEKFIERGRRISVMSRNPPP